MAVVKLHRATSSLLRGMDIAILMADGAEEVEYAHPRDFLERHGATVTVVAPKPESETVQTYSRTRPAHRFPVALDVRHALPYEFDALLTTGGVFQPRSAGSAIDFVRSFGKQYRTIGAACLGARTLMEARLVEGKRLTSWPTLREDLLEAGAEWVDEDVVVDGNLITARKPDDLPAFEEALLAELVRPSRGRRRE